MHQTSSDSAVFESRRYNSSHSGFCRCTSSWIPGSTKHNSSNWQVWTFLTRALKNLPQAVKFNCPFDVLLYPSLLGTRENLLANKQPGDALASFWDLLYDISLFCFLCYVFWRWCQVQWASGKQFLKLEKLQMKGLYTPMTWAEAVLKMHTAAFWKLKTH